MDENLSTNLLVEHKLSPWIAHLCQIIILPKIGGGRASEQNLTKWRRNIPSLLIDADSLNSSSSLSSSFLLSVWVTQT